MEIRKGHVYTADLNPHIGTEPGKVRPVVVVQTDLLNGVHPSTVICLITTHVQREAQYLRVHLARGDAGLKEPSDILVDQVRAIDNRRFLKATGKLSQRKPPPALTPFPSGRDHSQRFALYPSSRDN